MGDKVPARRKKRSLRQSTHPIPPERVEESQKQYDRRRTREETKEEVKRELEEE